MKTAVILLALVAMVAAQVQVVDNNPEFVQVVDYNPEQVQVVDNNPEQVQVVDNNNPSDVRVVDNNDPSSVKVVDNNPSNVVVVDNNNPSQVQVDDNPLPYDPNNFVVDPAFGRPGVSRPGAFIDPGFGRPSAYPENGAELIHKEPAFIDPPSRPKFPKIYDNPAWRGGK